MLTKEQIENRRKIIQVAIGLETESEFVNEMANQAIEAISLQQEVADLLKGNEQIHSIINGEIAMSGDSITLVRIALVQLFKESGAVNFYIQNMKDNEGNEYSMTVQKKDALSPEQKYMEVRAENAELREKLNKMIASDQ